MGKPTRVSVLGAGSWGTALAMQLSRNEHPTLLWGRDPEHIAEMRADRRNRRYLPEHGFADLLRPVAALDEALDQAELVLVVVPSHAFGETLRLVAGAIPTDAGFAWATKGLEHGSGRFLNELVSTELGAERPAAVVSGPSFAVEVAAGLPTAITVASADQAHAHRIATLLHGSGMIAFTSSDVRGVELGGAVKNVLAIAAGIADGLGFGANARAALITRGLAEFRRLAMALEVNNETLMGLTGVGDLVLTCTDDKSRNRRFGLAIGRGQSAEGARQEIGQVVEGAMAVREVMRLARQYQLSLPISAHVEQVLYSDLDPRAAVAELLSRPPRPE